jgi:hypothetical protein
VSETGSSSAGPISKWVGADLEDAANTAPGKKSPLGANSRAIDARYRYRRLLHAPMRPWQVTVAAVASVIPIAAGALLTWAMFAHSGAVGAVALFFITAGLEASLLWFATSPLYIDLYAERRGERFSILLREALPQAGRKSATSPVRTPRSLQAVAWPSAELALTTSRGFSVFALWPDAEPFLTERDWRELAVSVTRARALQGIAVSAVIVAIALIPLGVHEPQRSPLELSVLGAAMILVAAGALARNNWAGTEILDRKSQLIARYSAGILAAYSMSAATPAKRLRKLGELTGLILDGASGLPRSRLPGKTTGESLLPAVEEAVGERVEASIRQALHREPAINVMGALDLKLNHPSESEVELEVVVTTGPKAWEQAPGNDGRRFQLTGGEDRVTAPFEITVDAPGFDVRPARQAAEVGTAGATERWNFLLQGTWGDDVAIWVTLFSSGRYLQAVELAGASRRSGA